MNIFVHLLRFATEVPGSISILVSMCALDGPVECEDTVLPDTVLPRNITVIFATLVAQITDLLNL